jgi:hypothetical protein
MIGRLTLLLFAWFAASVLRAAEPSDSVKAYRKRANAEIGARWYTKVKAHRSDLTPGTVFIQYQVGADGRTRILKVEPRDGAKELFVKICREAVEESRLDPPPDEMKKQSTDGRVSGDITFTFNLSPYVSIYRPNGKVASKTVEEYRTRIANLFNQRLAKAFSRPSAKVLSDIAMALSIRSNGNTKLLKALSVNHSAKEYLNSCSSVIAGTTLPPPPAAALALGNGESYVEVLQIHQAVGNPVAR